jgi:hypothetical protein
MAVISNKNTTQTPLSIGSTGTQVIKFIDCPRVYIKAADASPTPITTKSNGATPSGYTDLGIVKDKVKVAYDKEMKEVRTGIDNVLRATYTGQKTATFEFVLSQFDDIVLGALSGVTSSVIQAGSTVQFPIGSEEVVQKALLIVLQNKIDGKEVQFYHPNAFMSFTIGDSGEETVVTGRGNLPMFTWGSGEAIFIMTDYA